MAKRQELEDHILYRVFEQEQQDDIATNTIRSICNLLGIDSLFIDDIQIHLYAEQSGTGNKANIKVRVLENATYPPDLRETNSDWIQVDDEMNHLIPKFVVGETVEKVDTNNPKNKVTIVGVRTSPTDVIYSSKDGNWYNEKQVRKVVDNG